MKHRFVRHGMLDDGVEGAGRVVLQADDGRAVHTNAVRLEFARQRLCVGARELLLLAAGGFQPEPDPLHAQLHELARLAHHPEHLFAALEARRPATAMVVY